MSEQPPEGFIIHLPNGIPVMVPPQMVDAFRQYWQSDPDSLIAVIMARPSQMSRELVSKLDARPFRRFRIIMKDGTIFQARFPGSIEFWHNTFMMMARDTPKVVNLTRNIDRIEDLGPAGIDWEKLRKESEQTK